MIVALRDFVTLTPKKKKLRNNSASPTPTNSSA